MKEQKLAWSDFSDPEWKGFTYNDLIRLKALEGKGKGPHPVISLLRTYFKEVKYVARHGISMAALLDAGEHDDALLELLLIERESLIRLQREHIPGVDTNALLTLGMKDSRALEAILAQRQIFTRLSKLNIPELSGAALIALGADHGELLAMLLTARKHFLYLIKENIPGLDAHSLIEMGKKNISTLALLLMKGCTPLKAYLTESRYYTFRMAVLSENQELASALWKVIQREHKEEEAVYAIGRLGDDSYLTKCTKLGIDIEAQWNLFKASHKPHLLPSTPAISTVGIEIECFFRNRYRDVIRNVLPSFSSTSAHTPSSRHSQWKKTFDETIHVDDQARQSSAEFISPILHGWKEIQTIRYMTETLQLIHAKTNQSCGLHVHIGFTNRFPPNIQLPLLKQLFLNYLFLENEVQFPKRTYAMRDYHPMFGKNADEIKKQCDHITKSKSIEALEEIVMKDTEGRKFAKINLKAISKHGTIEFREHPGTIKYGDIFPWVEFLLHVVQLTYEMVKKHKPHLPNAKEQARLHRITEPLLKHDSKIVREEAKRGSHKTNMTERITTRGSPCMTPL